MGYYYSFTFQRQYFRNIKYEYFQQNIHICIKIQNKNLKLLINSSIINNSYTLKNSMLQNKQPLSTSMDTGQNQFSLEQTQIPSCRYLHPSILNKSSMCSVTLIGAELQQLPEIGQNTQKVDLSHNIIKIFPLRYTNLKQICISNNLIDRLPEEINDMTCLRIVRANNNHINIIPFLKNIRHLQLNNNPIKLITTKLIDTRLQFLDFDWIPFLVNVYFESNDQGIIYALCDIIKKSIADPLQQFVRFDQVFQNRSDSLELRYLLSKAVTRKLDFFISYLKQFKGNIIYNGLIYNDRPIIQQVLEQNYDHALQLFTIRRSNLIQPEVYITNLVIACRYRNYNYFCYLIEGGLKRSVIKQNQFQIIETIFKSFDEKENSIEMLSKILYLSSFTQHNRKIFHLPRNYSLIEAENLCEGIMYVMNHEQLNRIIDFQAAVSQDLIQPLLHFSMTNRRPELVKIILQRYKKPFVKNYSGKLAKSIRGSVFSRKLVWKYEKKVIKQIFQQENITKTQISRRKSINNQKIFDNVYNQMMNPKLGRKVLQNHNNKQLEGNLISSRIQTVQKSLHQRTMIKSLISSRSSQIMNQSYSENLNAIDSTGILYQFALNMKKSNRLMLHNMNKKISPQMSSFSLYELYQKNLLDSAQKAYDLKKRLKKESSFSLLSPWTFCQQIEVSEGEEERVEYSGTKKGVCYQSCIDFEDTRLEVDK